MYVSVAKFSSVSVVIMVVIVFTISESRAGKLMDKMKGKMEKKEKDKCVPEVVAIKRMKIVPVAVPIKTKTKLIEIPQVKMQVMHAPPMRHYMPRMPSGQYAVPTGGYEKDDDDDHGQYAMSQGSPYEQVDIPSEASETDGDGYGAEEGYPAESSPMDGQEAGYPAEMMDDQDGGGYAGQEEDDPDDGGYEEGGDEGDNRRRDKAASGLGSKTSGSNRKPLFAWLKRREL
ncbi:hypothetical protein HDE_05358 [Halotydeus destructor]|nr:hypothetical protein HDE_05358 [Halotydeus destructor]